MSFIKLKHSRYIAIICCLALVVMPLFIKTPQASALTLLDTRYDLISTSAASANATHLIGFKITDPTTVGSIEFEFCSNNPLPATPCTAPTGFSASGVTLATQAGETGFGLHPNSTVNKIVLTRFPIAPTGNPASYKFTGIVNPGGAGSYYVRLRTFSSVDATGSDIQEGGLVFAIVNGVSVSAEVPPYLTFCAGVTITGIDCSSVNSFFIDMGEFRPSNTTRATSQFMIATNAQSGYTVTISGTTLTSGNNIIPAIAGASGPVVGTSQFGINLRANTNPTIGAEPAGPGVNAAIAAAYNNPNSYHYQTGETLVSSTNSDDFRKFTVSYMTDVSSGQAPGYYTTTLSFICLANF